MVNVYELGKGGLWLLFFLFAGLSVSMIPVMILYAFFQRHIVRGMIEGAVKG
ncbi:ABC-type glycerol-3-phosphate transport system permease component [Paenibacillus sp. V4I5]|nr:ABC-type glycerol-3-phosphate transport system permease component [Paenibacillus sp. V4I5]